MWKLFPYDEIILQMTVISEGKELFHRFWNLKCANNVCCSFQSLQWYQGSCLGNFSASVIQTEYSNIHEMFLLNGGFITQTYVQWEFAWSYFWQHHQKSFLLWDPYSELSESIPYWLATMMTWKCFQHYWSFVRGIHQLLMYCPHKGPVIWSFKVFFDVTLNKLLNTQVASDMRCHEAMIFMSCTIMPNHLNDIWQSPHRLSLPDLGQISCAPPAIECNPYISKGITPVSIRFTVEIHHTLCIYMCRHRKIKSVPKNSID